MIKYKSKWISSILILIAIQFSVFAQKQNKIAKFIITDVSQNGKNVSEDYLENNAYTILYSVTGDKRIHMANVWPKSNSQSFGPIFSLENSKIDETDENFETEIFKFNWEYHNTYNSQKGTSKVQLTKFFKPQGIMYELKLVTESLDVIVFKGYMEGTLDFSELEN